MKNQLLVMLCLAVFLAPSTLLAVSTEAALITAAAQVPKSDKNTAELIGTVVGIDVVTTECGVTATVVALQVKKGLAFAPHLPICTGSLVGPCAALRIGQRVKVQGILAPLPDVDQPGFNPCDINTWDFFIPAFGFGVTKITK
jgi:hypothetical protein